MDSFLTKIKSDTYIILLIVIIAALAYSRTIENDFVHWDDIDQIIDNPDISSLRWENIRSMFTKSYVSMYQPLVTLSFAIERALFGVDPRFFHLINLLFHLANIVLVYFVVRRLINHTPTALFAALIFAIHPMHVESVAWVTERKDVLYTFFYFLALLSYLRYADSQQARSYWFSLLWYTLSLLSKSAAVTFPVLLLLIHWYQQRPWTKSNLLRFIPFFLLALAFGIISLLTQTPQGNTSFFESYTAIDRIFLAFYAIAFYALHYFAPVGLCVFHPFPTKVNGWLPWNYYVAPLVVIGLIALLFIRWKDQRMMKFALGFFFLHIVLYLHLFPVGSAVVAERYTYIAYIGLSIAVAQGAITIASHLQWTKKTLVPILLIITILFSSITYSRVKVWNNTISLFDDAIKKTGFTICSTGMLSLGYHSRAKAYMLEKNYEKAIADLDSAAFYDPDIYEIFYDRGVCLMKLNEYQFAIEDFTRAIERDSTQPFIYDYKGLAFLRTERYDSALVYFSKAISIDSTFARAYANRGINWIHLNDINAACQDFAKAKELHFDGVDPLIEQYCKQKKK
ncbi:MAG TPA: glycosyltransferase family 39 protein [Bacteroidota bacterium]|nr:glycosyltransferase family 39 protein [Bacteroidota bacterium]